MLLLLLLVIFSIDSINRSTTIACQDCKALLSLRFHPLIGCPSPWLTSAWEHKKEKKIDSVGYTVFLFSRSHLEGQSSITKWNRLCLYVLCRRWLNNVTAFHLSLFWFKLIYKLMIVSIQPLNKLQQVTR